ncbi:MAG: glycine cleavage system protein T [Acidobacteria bacterium RIFCSPLOWO2_02_FULL_68_18]|nr:MAG: glycine cleavage system protein T [Acidobacteria bacterium RIFCSPLOWO2_02_FULL_68_18]OFW49943.1 MAG: glycine cleavage system protein T [Acidobacteria bacterium RIFCSPLOWO2_12_FULL_68_19]
MVPFAGWDMPVEYTGITREHMAVRTRAGLFDVSHMGEVEIAGKDALAAVERIACSDPAQLAVGEAQYAGLLTPDGTFLDDMIVYRLAPSHFLLVVNASNVAKDYTWISEQAKDAGDAAVIDSSDRYALLALQGPASQDVLQSLTGVELAGVGAFRFAHGEVAGARATIARTGYTGEDGFEVFIPPNMADRVWQAILEAGRPAGVIPAGLGARDTLRLEAAMRLYGNDIDESTTVLEAGLGWMIGWTNERFIGRDRLLRQKEQGVTRRLVGFEMIDPGIARHGCRVVQDGRPVGVVTSGTQTPFLKKAIGMAYVPVVLARAGSAIQIDIRGRAATARVVPMPFYKRGRDGVSG